MDKRIRVLVIDDSSFMRRAIQRMLSSEAGIEVVGHAPNGAEGLNQIQALRPDVVTLDIEMPIMDGLTALSRIRASGGPPVIMMSTLTQADSAASLKALELGAFDFVPKPQASMLDVYAVASELTAKVKAAAASGTRRGPALAPAPAPVLPRPEFEKPVSLGTVEIVTLGISTGGPPALQQVLPSLPANFGLPVLVVQHMPPGFTRSLAERLNQLCHVTVREAQKGDRPLPGQVLIAPAGWHMAVKRDAQGPVIDLLDSSDMKGWHKPSVDVMMASAASIYGARALGLIMTGMGNDGLAGAQALKHAGAPIWAQDEATSVVYGMPRAVAEAGLVDRVLPLARIGQELSALKSRL